MAKSYEKVLSAYESGIQEDIKKRTQFIQDHVEKAWKRGVLVGISGGLDSIVVATLVVKALGPSKVLGVWMPADSVSSNEKEVLEFAEAIGVKLININLEKSLAELINSVNAGLLAGNIIKDNEELSSSSVANTKSRAQMAALYAMSGQLGYLVVGTCNYTEIYLGNATKGGHLMYDFNPIGSLVKAQIRILAKALGIPGQIVDQESNAKLQIGQTNGSEAGFSYYDADRIILTGEGDPDIFKKIQYWHDNTEHKRKIAPLI